MKGLQQDKVTLIAEAGVNHNGSPETACSMVDTAADAGAHVFKIQSFQAQLLAGGSAPLADYQRLRTTHGNQQSMLAGLELDHEAHVAIAQRCSRRNIRFMSSPFDLPSLVMLVDLGVDTLKIASGELTNGPLLIAAARTGLPLIMSTGMATLSEVEEALATLAFGYLEGGLPGRREDLNQILTRKEAFEKLSRQVTLLHCTTAYPAPPDSLNLRAMDTLRQAFGLRVGYSDHSQGIAIALAAVARGAGVIEKHFTLDRSQEGPDHRASLEPHELADLVRGIEMVQRSLGHGRKVPDPAELPNMVAARKRIVTAVAIKRGTSFSEHNLTTQRPGAGLSPMEMWSWIGRTAERDYEPGEPLP